MGVFIYVYSYSLFFYLFNIAAIYHGSSTLLVGGWLEMLWVYSNTMPTLLIWLFTYVYLCIFVYSARDFERREERESGTEHVTSGGRLVRCYGYI